MKTQHSITITLGAILLSAATSMPAAAQCETREYPGYCAELEPRTHEDRINQFQMKSSHNSYMHLLEPSLTEQLDVFNTWQIELDLHFDINLSNSPPHGLLCMHDCADRLTTGSITLRNAMNEIRQSHAAETRVTFILVELKTDEQVCTQDAPWQDNGWRDDIYNTMTEFIDDDRFYTFEEFVNVDGWKWPSRQELLRRGKNFVVIVQHSFSGMNEEFFFAANGSNYILTNTEGGNNGVGYTGGDPQDVGDDLLSRVYPSWSLLSCFDQTVWYPVALTHGFNFTATDCVDHPAALNPNLILQPDPMYVLDTVQGPQGWGTFGAPHWGNEGLRIALLEAAPVLAEVHIQGNFDITEPIVITRPMTLVGDGGGAVIK